ncbi:hypothetical protein Tco_1418203 [Tanacetum coccineum]
MLEKIRLIRSEKERLEVRRNVKSKKTIRSETTIRSEKTVKKERNRLEVKRPFELFLSIANVHRTITRRGCTVVLKVVAEIVCRYEISHLLSDEAWLCEKDEV